MWTGLLYAINYSRSDSGERAIVSSVGLRYVEVAQGAKPVHIGKRNTSKEYVSFGRLNKTPHGSVALLDIVF